MLSTSTPATAGQKRVKPSLALSAVVPSTSAVMAMDSSAHAFNGEALSL